MTKPRRANSPAAKVAKQLTDEGKTPGDLLREAFGAALWQHPSGAFVVRLFRNGASATLEWSPSYCRANDAPGFACTYGALRFTGAVLVRPEQLRAVLAYCADLEQGPPVS